MGAGFAPTAVCLLRLFAKGKRDTQGAVAYALDFAYHPFDKGNESLVLPLTALEHHRAVAIAVGKNGSPQDFLPVQGITHGVRIGTADATVKAVLHAAVGEFNQTAQVNAVAQGGIAHRTAAGKQQLLLLPPASQKSREFGGCPIFFIQ